MSCAYAFSVPATSKPLKSHLSSALKRQKSSKSGSARWLVELFFRELKTSYRLDQMPSSKRHIVEALIYAALLTMVASRVLLEHFRSLMAVDLRQRIPEERWAGLFATKASDILAILVRPRRDADVLERYLVPFIVAEAIDPNVARSRLLGRVEDGHVA